MPKKIKGKVLVDCQVKERVALSYLTPLQESLKSLTDENYKKLKDIILKRSFRYPIYVWSDDSENKTYIVDGHQRYYTLERMKKEGYSIPKIPILFVNAKNISEARQSVLELAAQFGDVSEIGLRDFIKKAGINFASMKAFHFPALNLKFEAVKVEKKEKVKPEIPKAKGASKLLHRCPKCEHEWSS